MKISIITPTLQRESLIACCESVNGQLECDWEHVVVVDCFKLDEDLVKRIRHPRRVVLRVGPYNNWANTPRHIAWEFATGDYLCHCDDDNWLSDGNILRDMSISIEAAGNPNFCLFPIQRHGHIFFHDPPLICLVDTGNIVVRRDIGRWPNIAESTSDGIFAEHLDREYGCVGFPDFRPIIQMPGSSRGKSTREGEGMEW